MGVRIAFKYATQEVKGRNWHSGPYLSKIVETARTVVCEEPGFSRLAMAGAAAPVPAGAGAEVAPRFGGRGGNWRPAETGDGFRRDELRAVVASSNITLQMVGRQTGWPRPPADVRRRAAGADQRRGRATVGALSALWSRAGEPRAPRRHASLPGAGGKQAGHPTVLTAVGGRGRRQRARRQARR